MNSIHSHSALALALALTLNPALWLPLSAPAQTDTIVPMPARGGGLDTTAPMIHVDIFYDSSANLMTATLDTSHGIPHLKPLPAGHAFDPASLYDVLNGKAYNFQYAWNPGGIFAPPQGAALWIECLDHSPGLENYDGPGNRFEDPPRPWAPIFGTGDSPSTWSWYGRMAHNAYAISDPLVPELSASYRIYFGDAITGAPDAFAAYDDATVTLNFTVDPVPEPASALLLALGLAGLLLVRNTRRGKSG